MTSIGDVTAPPSGTPYLMFDGTTYAYESYIDETSYDGIEATGIYKFQNGIVTRLSGPAQACSAGCTTVSDDPQPASNGTYFFDAWGCAGSTEAQDFTCSGAIHHASIAGGATSGYESSCTGFNFTQHATPDPVNPARLVYDSCPSTGGSELDVAGEHRAGDVVIGSSGTCTGVTLNDPSWRPDGGQIIAYQGGGDESCTPGLYAYNPAGGNTRTRVLYAPLDPHGTDTTKYPYVFSDPRYIGENTLMFTADGNTYTIPASCGNCNFPANAKLLIHGGSNASWTPLSLVPSPATTPKFSHLALAKTHVTPKQGFKLNVTLNEAAELVVQVLRSVTTRVHGKFHTTYKVVGTIGGKAVKGSASYSVKTVSGHELKAGTYRLLVLAIAGKLKSAIHQLALVVT